MIKQLDFELACLALLTQEGIKPLSRWESALPLRATQTLAKLGLSVARVPRLLRNGSWVEEVIFSARSECITEYIQLFYGQPLSKSPQHQRDEGRLFGYPSCCVEHFIRRPYDVNGLSPADQRVLFHWACPNCRATGKLLPAYHRIHRILRDQHIPSEMVPAGNSLRRSLAIAASISILALGTVHCDPDWITIPPPFEVNPHLFALPGDVDGDQDFLEDRYEPILGLDNRDKDSDGDGLMDGPDLALALLPSYLALPNTPRTDGPYVEDHMLRGLEQCNVCQQTVNMGYARLVNPLENLEMELPYLFLHHFLKHGSFSYDGSLHGEGRVNAALLRIILQGDGTAHLLGAAADPALQAQAHTLGIALDGLPREVQADRVYVIEHQAKGLEMCHSCGQSINMGYLELVNPVKNARMDIPIIAVHYLHCGSFSYQGDLHKGVIDAAALTALLQ